LAALVGALGCAASTGGEEPMALGDENIAGSGAKDPVKDGSQDPASTDKPTTTGDPASDNKPATTGDPVPIDKPDSTEPVTADCVPSSGSGKTAITPLEYCDPAMKCYDFVAHAPGDKGSKFMVSTQPDLYTNFTYMAPWKDMAYARSFTSIIDNDQVIHHWLLYKTGVAATDGDVGPSLGAHPGSELLAGWAPGANDSYYDPDLGQEMQGGVAYVLETHHNNTTGAAAPDSTGVRICVTPKAPKFVAGVSWLGTDLINGTTASGVCDPTSTEPIHLLGTNPHMHTKATHMSIVVTRADGTIETLHDEPFDFYNQRAYGLDTDIMPGDTIKTTCTFKEPATFGEKTSSEMCYAFTLAYPKLALTNGNLIFSTIHGPNTCLN
jgi:hypothetical protein